MALLLASLTELKALMGWSGTGQDTLGTTLLLRASAIAEQLAGRPLCRQASITEYPVRGSIDDPRRVRVQRWPIETLTSIKQLYTTGTDADFTAESALTENTDFVIQANRGLIERVNARWYVGLPRCLQIVYTGGYYDPSSAAPSGTAVAPPEDLKHGVLQQAIRMFQTKDSAGLREIDLGEHGGRVSLAESKYHPALIEVCQSLKEITL